MNCVLSIENGRMYKYYSCPICHKEVEKRPYAGLNIIRSGDEIRKKDIIKMKKRQLILYGDNGVPTSYEIEVI